MSRRDTIIIAVLINAGLLAILFVMALKNDEEKITAHPEIEQMLVQAQTTPKSIKPTDAAPSKAIEHGQQQTQQPADEFDHVLNDLNINDSHPILLEDVSEDAKTLTDYSTTLTVIPNPPQKAEDIDRVTVTVKKGDSLEKIAKANGTTVSAIMKANELKSEKLKVGQVLNIPVPVKKENEKKTPSAETPKNAEAKEVEYYTIKSGDNPWKIAKKHHVKVEDLLKLNDMNEEKARNMKVGEKIRIR